MSMYMYILIASGYIAKKIYCFYGFIACADPENRVIESNEKNNCRLFVSRG